MGGFERFALDERLLSALETLSYDQPTAVQEQAIAPLLEGKDVIGRARTGSGKTAAFGLPLLERVKEGGPARALVLTPTRELALQVSDALRSYAKHIKGLRIVTVYGGAPYPPQLKALRAGVTVVVGTPGRVIDHLDRGSLNLSGIEYFVLDEADEMLRMGFIDDVEKVLQAMPDSRQVALFSATMPEPIQRVARAHLKEPIELRVESRELVVEHIQQHWLRVPERFKLDALVRVLRGVAHGTTLVFARTRAGCAEMADALAKRGVAVEALHGDLSQAARERVVQGLRSRRLQVVIATDVAARGIDVDHITHVINLDLPPDAESYVHRIGRTARAGREGTAISFVTPRAVGRLTRLRRVLKVPITAMDVPSDADIARLERGRLKARLQEAVQGEVTDGAKTLLHEAIEDSAYPLEQLAAAALHLLAQSERVTLGDIPEEGRPAWAVRPEKRDRNKGDRPRNDRSERDRGPDETREADLFFPIGFTRGVRPADLVGLLANEADVPARSIGRITIRANMSFVGVSQGVAQHVLQLLPEVKLRGVVVPISIARPRNEEPTRGRAGRPPRGGRPVPKRKRADRHRPAEKPVAADKPKVANKPAAEKRAAADTPKAAHKSTAEKPAAADKPTAAADEMASAETRRRKRKHLAADQRAQSADDLAFADKPPRKRKRPSAKPARKRKKPSAKPARKRNKPPVKPARKRKKPSARSTPKPDQS